MKIFGLNLPLLPRPASASLRDLRPVTRRQTLEAGDRLDSAGQPSASPLPRRGQSVESWPYAGLRDGFADAQPTRAARPVAGEASGATLRGGAALVETERPPGAAAFAYQWPLAATLAADASRSGDVRRTIDASAIAAALDPAYIPDGNRRIYLDNQPRWTLSTRLYP